MTSEAYTLTACGRAGVERRVVLLESPTATEVQIEVEYSLVSVGTERHYLQQVRTSGEHLALGYCVAGRVLTCGADVSGLTPGMPVIAMGWNLATHSDRVNMPQRLVCPVPDGLSLDKAILATLGATVVHALDRAPVRAGERVLIVGMGLVGQLLALVAGCHGAQVWGTDKMSLPQSGLPVQWLDYTGDWTAYAGYFSQVILCIDDDITELLPHLIRLLNADGNAYQRPRLVNVGRVALRLELSPQLGNIDIINVSRCGAGYRDDAYHHGLKTVTCLPGEATVDENLARCLVHLLKCPDAVASFTPTVWTPTQSLTAYNSAAFFPAGINLIRHCED